MKQVEEYQKTIPTVGIHFEQYDPKNIDVWDTYIPIDDEKQRTLDAILSGKTPYLIESEKGQGKTLLIHTICKENDTVVGHAHADANNMEKLLEQGFRFFASAPERSYTGLEKGLELVGR